jgi:hypothetical protein
MNWRVVLDILALVACGTLCYFIYWLRHRASGRIRMTPDLLLLWLLFWAALIFAVSQTIVRNKNLMPSLP